MTPPPPDPKDPRAAILARRAQFVAIALAGIACGKSTGNDPQADPRPCLNQTAIPRDGDAPPQPCLSQPMPTTKPDAGTSPPPTPPTPTTTTTEQKKKEQ